MTKYQFIQRLQNSPLTSWLWRYWQHEDTGYITKLVIWKNPGKRWYKVTESCLMYPNEERLKRLKGPHYTAGKSEFGSFESSNRLKKEKDND